VPICALPDRPVLKVSRHDVKVTNGDLQTGKIVGAVVLGLPLLAACLVMPGRVGATARFVTWPIVAFTVLAATVAMVGMWVGLDRPWLLAAGVLPGLMVAYVLPGVPVPVAAIVLVGLTTLAIGARGIAAGTAMSVGATMVLFVVTQGPAVECRKSSVSSTSGPWWVPSPNSSSASGTGAPDGEVSGNTEVGSHRYEYACAEGRLTRFERAD
jgi:hypothetical protein